MNVCSYTRSCSNCKQPECNIGVHVAIGHNQYSKHISTIGQCIIMQMLIEVFEIFLRSRALLVTCS